MPIKDIDALTGLAAVLDTTRLAAWPSGDDVPRRGTALQAAEYFGKKCQPGWVTGEYYPTFTGASASAAPAAVDTLYAYPFELPRGLTLASAAFRCNGGGAASAVKSAIYASNTAGRPTGAALAADNTGAATTGSGTIAQALSGALPLDVLWVLQKYTGTLPTMLGLGATSYGLGMMLGRATLSASAASGLSLAHTYATAFPTLTGAEGWAHVIGGGPAILFLVP